MSDLNGALRATAAVRPGEAGAALAPAIADAFSALLGNMREPRFAAAALAKRSSRAVGDLPRLTPSDPVPPVAPSTRLRHAPLAAMHRFDAGAVVDLAVPGGHILLHPAATPALAFIAATPVFAVSDIPGLPPEHCTALAARLCAAGLLEVAGEQAALSALPTPC